MYGDPGEYPFATRRFQVYGDATSQFTDAEVEAARVAVGRNLVSRGMESARVIYVNNVPSSVHFGDEHALAGQVEDVTIEQYRQAAAAARELPVIDIARADAKRLGPILEMLYPESSPQAR